MFFMISGRENGAVLSVDPDSQRQLFSLLYFVPDIGIRLIEILTNLIRSDRVVEENVTYLINVIYNRFVKKCKLIYRSIIKLLQSQP